MKFTLPDIPQIEQTPVVKGLLAMIEQLIEHTQKQQEDIELMKDEIRILKGEKKRPIFTPSKLDESTNDDLEEATDKENKTEPSGKKDAKQTPKKTRRSKKTLPVDREERISPRNIPQGSRYKGYRDFHVQELVIKSEHIRYRLERWLTPDGQWLMGKLPDSLENRHYGPTLLTYLLYQHHHCQTTQPLLLEQLREGGITLSSGQLNRLLSEKKERFHAEKEGLLEVALTQADYITVDDSGARHKGKNGYVTHMGNEFFAWFRSTPSKSRVNFLTLLNGGEKSYRLSPEALTYMREHKLKKVPRTLLDALAASPVTEFIDKEAWDKQLKHLNITDEHHIRIATEGALMGALLHKGNVEKLAIISDGAGQFAVFQHGLCWVHAERLIHPLLPMNDTHKKAVEDVRAQIWTLYRALKSYKLRPSPTQAQAISSRFDNIFQQKTAYVTLNRSLRRLYKLKNKLLLVLKRPDIPIHINGSEGDIRDYVKKRKVSGGTRSDVGQQCRDTFASLKKTCRKLGLSFWQYLFDRHHDKLIPPLPVILSDRLTGTSPVTTL
jgi:hypothetical protein